MSDPINDDENDVVDDVFVDEDDNDHDVIDVYVDDDNLNDYDDSMYDVLAKDIHLSSTTFE